MALVFRKRSTEREENIVLVESNIFKQYFSNLEFGYFETFIFLDFLFIFLDLSTIWKFQTFTFNIVHKSQVWLLSTFEVNLVDPNFTDWMFLLSLF